MEYVARIDFGQDMYKNNVDLIMITSSNLFTIKEIQSALQESLRKLDRDYDENEDESWYATDGLNASTVANYINEHYPKLHAEEITIDSFTQDGHRF